jgi:alkylation response protein AidB-like acyl-CoA dehydrogenase
VNFSLSAEQQTFVERVREFARQRVAPEAAAIDAAAAFPHALVKDAAALGLMGVTIPKEWGGLGRDYLSYALAIEAIAHSGAVLAVILTVNNSLVAEPIRQFGTDEHRDLWLRRLAIGDAIGAFALSEAGAGSDAANQKTTARFDGHQYVLTGKKV